MSTLKTKIANAHKSRILVIAWKIRRNAAAKYNCNPTKILMKECVEQAWKIEKHAEQQPVKIPSKQEIIDLFNSGKIEQPTPQEAQIIVDALFEGKIKALPTNKRINQDKFPTVNIKMGIPKKPEKAPTTDQEIAKKIMNFAGKNDSRKFLNHAIRTNNYFIASNGHQAAFMPRKQTNHEENQFVDDNNSIVIVDEDTKEQISVGDTMLNFLNREKIEQVKGINARTLEAYLRNIAKLKRIIDCRFDVIAIPIRIGEQKAYFNADYLLNAINSLATHKRLEVSFVTKNDEDECQILRLENDAGEKHLIMPINKIEHSVVSTLDFNIKINTTIQLLFL